MGPVCSKKLIDQWLEEKCAKILNKSQAGEVITDVDMLILAFASQAQHIQSLEIEFRDEFKCIDRRLDRFATIMMWGGGLLATAHLGLILRTYYH